MEKQADPVDKVEGATSVVSEKEEVGKEEAVPEEGATAIDPTKAESTEGAVLDKQESSKENSASISSTGAHDFACDSIDEYASASYRESESRESIATPDQQSQTQETNNVRCISDAKLALILTALSLVLLCAGVWHLQKLMHGSKAVDDIILTVLLISVAMFLLMVSLYYVKHGVEPASAANDPSIHYQDLRSEAGSEDVESRRIGSSGSDYQEATDKQQDGSDKSTAGPSQEGASSSGVSSEKQPILQPTTSKGDSIMKLSEIASAVSQIASGTTQEGPEESVKEKPKDQNVAEKADDNLQKDSEQEDLSSTELRRRNFQNPDSCTDLKKSAEAKE